MLLLLLNNIVHKKLNCMIELMTRLILSRETELRR